ncbi:MAG: DUF3072 domain-containing protein [Tardiphaga sp.]
MSHALMTEAFVAGTALSHMPLPRSDAAGAIRPASYDVLRDRLSGPMTRSQALTLKSLAIEAYQPKQFEKDLTRAEAARRIEALREEIALADSF